VRTVEPSVSATGIKRTAPATTVRLKNLNTCRS
jgi:hypothetical protein